MNDDHNYLIDKMVTDIQSKSKYHSILPEVIRNIANQEYLKRNNQKEINKAIRSRLHQIAGAFIERKINYQDWLEKLYVSKNISKEAFINSSLQLMRLHTSTDERIPILRDFYHKIFAEIGPLHSILDLACGLNPLSFPWIPSSENFKYYACDIFLDMINFLNKYFEINMIKGEAFGCDLINTLPKVEVQVTFLLKTIPLLDQTDRSIAKKIITQVNSEFVLVSFPIKSLSGKNVGMENTYKQRFNDILGDHKYKIQSFEFSNEMVYLIKK